MSYDMSGAPREFYATAGLGAAIRGPFGFGAVDPGIDVSHYGAPYQGMLGLGAALGQAGDNRWLKRFAKVRQTYKVSSISGQSAAVATTIERVAQREFAGMTVRKASGGGYGSGWGPGGRVGVDIIIPRDMPLIDIKRKGKALQLQNVISGVSSGAKMSDARTSFAAGDVIESPVVGEEAEAGVMPIPTGVAEDDGFFGKKVGGVPVWAIGGLGVLAVAGLAVAMRKKKPKPVSANRRRRRRRARR